MSAACWGCHLALHLCAACRGETKVFQILLSCSDRKPNVHSVISRTKWLHGRIVTYSSSFVKVSMLKPGILSISCHSRCFSNTSIYKRNMRVNIHLLVYPLLITVKRHLFQACRLQLNWYVTINQSGCIMHIGRSTAVYHRLSRCIRPQRDGQVLTYSLKMSV